MKTIVLLFIIVAFIFLGYLFRKDLIQNKSKTITNSNKPAFKKETPLFPLSIKAMREKKYPGSQITIEQTLADGSNYHQYIASYLSDGLKIYALLTIPEGQKPKAGWPVIIFNHGYIDPSIYRTTERYVAYVDALARSGYIVFKSDYRGNGSSEGKPEGAYYSPAYATDVLNAIASVKKLTDANPNKIGMWGHSMGGNIALRVLVVDPKDIKAAVIWGGVVGSYNDLIYNWQRRVSYQPGPRELVLRNNYRNSLLKQYGDPKTNPSFWNTIDPTAYLSSITSPIQLHHGLADEEVPVSFSQNLYNKLKSFGKTVEFYTYPGADHNISDPSFSLAMQRTIKFFDKYLK